MINVVIDRIPNQTSDSNAVNASLLGKTLAVFVSAKNLFFTFISCIKNFIQSKILSSRNADVLPKNSDTLPTTRAEMVNQMVEKTVEINTRRVALGNQIAKKKLQMNEAIGIKPQCLDDDDEREALRNELNREKYEKMKNDPTVLQLKKEIAQLEEEAQALDIEAQQHKACLNLIDYLLDGIDNSKDQRKLIGIYLDEEPAFMKLVGGNVKKEYDNLQKLVANGASPDAIREAKEKLTNLYNKMAVEFANELRENHGFSLVPA